MTDVVLDGATGDVYASTDWVYGLSLTPGSRTLWAATHGRGAWKLALP